MDALIRTAEAADVPALTETLAAAFVDDPVMSWLLPRRRPRRKRLRRFFALELRLVGLERGTVWTSDDHAGAVITAPPGQWRLPWAVSVRNGPAFTRAFGPRLPLASALLALMEHRHLREAHHYVPYIGVAPQAQGRGLGTRLMAPILARCDEEGVPAYLEATSPRNVVLYERLGFVATGRLRLGASPPLVLMRREPGTA